LTFHIITTYHPTHHREVYQLCVEEGGVKLWVTKERELSRLQSKAVGFVKMSVVRDRMSDIMRGNIREGLPYVKTKAPYWESLVQGSVR